MRVKFVETTYICYSKNLGRPKNQNNEKKKTNKKKQETCLQPEQNCTSPRPLRLDLLLSN